MILDTDESTGEKHGLQLSVLKTRVESQFTGRIDEEDAPIFLFFLTRKNGDVLIRIVSCNNISPIWFAVV